MVADLKLAVTGATGFVGGRLLEPRSTWRDPNALNSKLRT